MSLCSLMPPSVLPRPNRPELEGRLPFGWKLSGKNVAVDTAETVPSRIGGEASTSFENSFYPGGPGWALCGGGAVPAGPAQLGPWVLLPASGLRLPGRRGLERLLPRSEHEPRPRRTAAGLPASSHCCVLYALFLMLRFLLPVRLGLLAFAWRRGSDRKVDSAQPALSASSR